MTADDVRLVLRRECADAGSPSVWADAHNVSKQYVTNVLRGWDPPGDKILAALGLRWTIERIGE